jgi:GT2 family glycosyltransferase
MSPAVIGLTLNYREATRTTACITSLLAEDVCAVLVWDNSEDNGVSARELSARWSGEPRVHIRSSPCNLGFAAGANQGLREIAQCWPGAWTLLINNDAILLRGSLTALHELLLANDKGIIAHPIIDHCGRSIGTAYYQRHLGLITTSRLPAAIAYASGCAMLIATERAKQPLFDEDFFMYGEDILLGSQLGEAHMLHLPQTGVRHEGSASSGMGSAFYESRMVAAHWLLARKLAVGPADRAVLLWGRVLSLSARALVRAVRYRSTRPLWALWAGERLAHGDDPELQAARIAAAGLNAVRQAPPALGTTPHPPLHR